MLPGVAVYVFVGTSISSIASALDGSGDDDGKPKPEQTVSLVLFIVGSILACGGIVYVSVVAKRILNEELKKAEEADDENKEGTNRDIEAEKAVEGGETK